jgi:hypothetical protein
MSSAVGSRPASRPDHAIPVAIAAANSNVNRPSVDASLHGGLTASTVWPSDRNSSAASSTAPSAAALTCASGSTGLVARPIRRRAGTCPPATAKG